MIDNSNGREIKISIVIPVYNAEKYLEQCLDSVLSQSLREIEIICIDDCSTDSSYNILCDYAERDERVIVLKNAENMHAGICRNKGIDTARGEYVHFLDADDYLADGALEQEYRAVTESNLDFIKVKAYDIDTITGKEIENSLTYDNLQFFPSDLFDTVINFREYPMAFRRVAVVPWNGLYKRSFIKQNNLKFNSLKCVNDRSFYISVLVRARRAMVSDIGAVYHRVNNPDSLVGNRFNNFDCHFKSYNIVLNEISSLPAQLQYRIMDSELSDICGWFNKINNREDFERIFADAKDFFEKIDIGFLLRETENLGETVNKKIWNKVYEDVMSLTPEQYILKNKMIMHRPRENKDYDVKISLIIPVYNMEEYLDECLDSILYQTLGEIEVICVDDCSADNSVSVIRRRAESDARIKLITYDVNKSASQCRKDGVAAAKGKYIMFVDADDALMPSALENLYTEMENEPVDILHFNAEIVNEGNLPQSRIDNMKKFVSPYDGKLSGCDIFEKCFSNKLYRFTIWNKIYDASLCKLAFSSIKDGSFPKAQDLYAYFVLAFYAESYRGIPNQTYYEYHFGRGSTGHNSLDMKQFERYCKMGLVADAIYDFLQEKGALEILKKSYETIRKDLVIDCVGQWNNCLDNEQKPSGLELMVKYFDAPEIIARVIQLNSSRQEALAKIALKTDIFDVKKRSTKTIGMHYFRLANGGIQRVLSMLSFIFIKMGYAVVIFCEEPPSDSDYDLPDGVKIVVLPDTKQSFKKLADHLTAFHRELIKNNIDLFIDHAWLDFVGLLAHALTVKALGIPLIIHCHNVFSAPVLYSGMLFSDMPYIYSLADHIVTLSNTDREYWKQFNDRVTTVSNPLTFDLDSITPTSLQSKNIIWIARVSNEKRPMDAVDIFDAVAKQEPTAKMYLVGGSKTDDEMQDLKSYIDSRQLTDKIVVTGFVKDVEKYYNDSSVFICTSLYEGFLLTLLESQSFGIPTVMYELPWLTITEENRGIISVPQGDIQSAANAIVKLLNDYDLRVKMGMQARENIEKMAKFDFEGTWSKIIADAANSNGANKIDKYKRMMFDTLYSHYKYHILEVKKLRKPTDKIKISSNEQLTETELIQKLNWNRSDRKKLIDEVEQLKKNADTNKELKKKYDQTKSERDEYLCEINNIRSSLSFKIGRFFTWLPRKIRALLRRG